MSADEFWRDDPQLFVSYRTSFINKKKRELEETDYKCWLQGLYIHDGNSKISSHLRKFISNTISSMFKGKKDNSKIENYPGKPYTELEKDKRKQDEETMRTNKYKEYENSLVYYGTLKQQYIERIKNKAKKGE